MDHEKEAAINDVQRKFTDEQDRLHHYAKQSLNLAEKWMDNFLTFGLDLLPYLGPETRKRVIESSNVADGVKAILLRSSDKLSKFNFFENAPSDFPPKTKE